MEEVRCIKCNKLLAKVEKGVVEIKCPRCKTINKRVIELPIRTPRVSIKKGSDRHDTIPSKWLDRRQILTLKTDSK